MAKSVKFLTADQQVQSIEPGDSYNQYSQQLQNSCYDADSLVISEPRYNFRYTFQQLESSTDISYSFYQNNGYLTDLVHRYLGENVSKKLAIADFKLEGFHYGIRHGSLQSDKKNLLDQGNFKDFFRLCGTHYIQSVVKSSGFLAFFIFDSQSSDTSLGSDSSFLEKLEEYILRVTNSDIPSDLQDFVLEAKQRKTKVQLEAFGLAEIPSSLRAPVTLEVFVEQLSIIMSAIRTEASFLGGLNTSFEISDWLYSPNGLVLNGSNMISRLLEYQNAQFLYRLRETQQEIAVLPSKINLCYNTLLSDYPTQQDIDDMGLPPVVSDQITSYPLDTLFSSIDLKLQIKLSDFRASLKYQLDYWTAERDNLLYRINACESDLQQNTMQSYLYSSMCAQAESLSASLMYSQPRQWLYDFCQPRLYSEGS